MAYEVKITLTFTTGSSASDEEVAKAGCLKVLGDMLKEHAGKITDIFSVKVDKTEAGKL